MGPGERPGLSALPFAPVLVDFRGAVRQFAQQVLPFVGELAGGDRDDGGRGSGIDFRGVEGVAACPRFGGDGGEIGVDRPLGSGVAFEPLQLRVVPVAAGGAMQYGAGEQAFAPEGEQTLAVEVAGV